MVHGVANSRTQPRNYTATASELSGWCVKVGRRCFLRKSKQKGLQGEGQHGAGDEERPPRPGTQGRREEGRPAGLGVWDAESRLWLLKRKDVHTKLR